MLADILCNILKHTHERVMSHSYNLSHFKIMLLSFLLCNVRNEIWFPQNHSLALDEIATEKWRSKYSDNSTKSVHTLNADYIIQKCSEH